VKHKLIRNKVCVPSAILSGFLSFTGHARQEPDISSSSNFNDYSELYMYLEQEKKLQIISEESAQNAL
jgi:hypothetical protein